MILLDGRRLAQLRETSLSARAAALTKTRGRAPTLAIVAFGARGRAPWLGRKLLACAGAGVDVFPLILDPATMTDDAVMAIHTLTTRCAADGVFLQIPTPSGINETSLTAAIPEACDVDVMTPGRVRAFLAGDAEPPVTVSAALELLAGYDIDIRTRVGVLVADESPFSVMFRVALERAGAEMAPLLPPDAHHLQTTVRAAQLVVCAAARPGLIAARDIAKGAVAIDVGYFNPRGVGDIEASSGAAHLHAFAPVPGGIGPMTVSALIERVIRFAEATGDSNG